MAENDLKVIVKAYAVLEFKGPNGVSREAFDLPLLTEKNRVLDKKNRM